jgi:hypothetical protein
MLAHARRQVKCHFAQPCPQPTLIEGELILAVSARAEKAIQVADFEAEAKPQKRLMFRNQTGAK